MQSFRNVFASPQNGDSTTANKQLVQSLAKNHSSSKLACLRASAKSMRKPGSHKMVFLTLRARLEIPIFKKSPLNTGHGPKTDKQTNNYEIGRKDTE